MTRPKTKSATTATATTTAAPATPVKPSKTSHLFATRKSKGPPPVTHENIAADIDAFHKAGGRIEVLGTTQVLQRIGVEGDDAAPRPTPVQFAPGRSRR